MCRHLLLRVLHKLEIINISNAARRPLFVHHHADDMPPLGQFHSRALDKLEFVPAAGVGDADGLGNFEPLEDGRGGSYRVELRGAINECGVVKPRYSVRRQEYEKWESRYLPAQDFGLLILTTNQGIMNHYDAKDSRIGGRFTFYRFFNHTGW